MSCGAAAGAALATMSCKHPKADVEVLLRRCHHHGLSWHGGYATSEYSLVRCKRCGHRWRTRARYVSAAPDAKRDTW